MHILNIPTAFEDARGTIRDLVTDEIHSITEITFTPGSIRGNHVHRHTTQWTYRVSGELTMATIDSGKVLERDLIAGDIVVSLPNEPHAFRAITQAKILVFTKGPRSGSNYELDTQRVVIIN
jgi:quercetin dioxygenase-like cupin family protein